MMGHRNEGFASVFTLNGGTIVTTKFSKSDDEDEEMTNVGFEKLPEDNHAIGLFIFKVRRNINRMIEKHRTVVQNLIKLSFLLIFIIYFGFAMSSRFGTPAFPIRGNIFYGNAGFALLLLVAFGIFIVVWERSLNARCGRGLEWIENQDLWISLVQRLSRFSRFAHLIVLLLIAAYVSFTVRRPRNYVSLFGIIALIGIGMLGSKYPHRIRWKTVLYSFVIQFILAAVVIRLEIGFQIFNFLGKEVSKFIHNADSGAIFVFGKNYQDHFFVFKVTSIIIFLGSTVNVLYYLGVMQYVIGKIAWLMQNCLHTTAAESMNAAANIFVGMSEAPLTIMPLIPDMTTSELHAVFVGGFATMAGSVLATFIFFGVPANHLIAASVMAAPGALGFAKLMLPETHRSKTTWDQVKNTPLPEQQNVIDALLTGAGHTLKICGYLVANLIAFISVLHFADTTLLGFIFYPFAILIGIPIHDCLVASKLIGIKVSLNEFIAYQELGRIRQLREELLANQTFHLYLQGNSTLQPGTPMLWDDSSIVILTYALCGFANFGSMGVALAAMGVFAPARKRTMAIIAPRALITANLVSLMTASIAGLLYEDRTTTSFKLPGNTTFY